MSDKKRYPTLCSWCQHCITGRESGRRAPLKDPPSGYSTYCLQEHFDHDGKENYPDKTECVDYKLAEDVTATDLHWWQGIWVAEELKRLEIKKTKLENED